MTGSRSEGLSSRLSSGDFSRILSGVGDRTHGLRWVDVGVVQLPVPGAGGSVLPGPRLHRCAAQFVAREAAEAAAAAAAASGAMRGALRRRAQDSLHAVGSLLGEHHVAEATACSKTHAIAPTLQIVLGAHSGCPAARSMRCVGSPKICITVVYAPNLFSRPACKIARYH